MNKICIITPSFAKMKCGLADYVTNLVRFLNLKDLDISVITSDNPKIKEYVNSGKKEDFKIYPFISKWGWRSLFRINKLTGNLRPDVVHIMYHWNIYNDGILKGLAIAFMPFFFKLRPKPPIVIISFVHDIMGPYLFPKAGPLRNMGLFLMVLFADKLTVHTEHHKTGLNRIFPFLKKEIHCIPCGGGIFYDQAAGSRRIDSHAQAGVTTLSFFGYIYPSKGLEYLIGAMQALLEKGYKLKLILIGGLALDYKIKGFDAYPERIKELILAAGLEPFVEWLGFCRPEDVSANLLRSDICVLPFNEGVNERGSSFNTVLSHGLPLITTRGPYVPKKLIDRENVLLIPPRDSKSLAGAIEELICDKGLREKLSCGAKKLYEKEYSWQVIADKTALMYC